jgi:hypothetical protein
MIELLMPYVNDGSNEPLIIYRNKDGSWGLRHTQNELGETGEWVRDIEKKDPSAIIIKGADMSDGSYPTVYDKVLIARLFKEYEATHKGEKRAEDFRALANFLEDAISEIPHDKVTFLTILDRPLAFVEKILPFSLKSNDTNSYYNEDRFDEALNIIEDEIEERLGHAESLENTKKRNIEGYEEKYNIRIAGKEIVFAVNQKADMPYLVCDISWDNPLNLETRRNGAVSSDYVEALREFLKRVDTLAQKIEADREASGIPQQVMTADDCIPGSARAFWEGEVLIVRPERLAPEYRDAAHQLVYCTGGFGANPDASGTKVYIKELLSGKEYYYNRSRIAGIADPEKMPKWATEKLAELLTQIAKKKEAAEKPKPSVLDALDKGKKKVVQTDTARAEQSKKPQVQKRNGQAWGD